ncbi:MAG: Rpn family recombination-promoting nuclease/putative transposase [Succinivibrio sp.]|nr:Rpn family recombination-promoting nuclease/putative transposase [Succinivibrio sp.]
MPHEKDLSQKALIKIEDIFADIINTLIYKGKQKVLPSALTELSEQGQLQAFGRIFERERDVLKQWSDQAGFRISLLGVEMQSASDPYMPLRILVYDASNYGWMLTQLSDPEQKPRVKPVPVITLVLYHGLEPWHGPTQITGCFKVPEGLEDFVSDYHINVIDVGALPREVIDTFRSEYREFADYLWQWRHNGCYRQPRRDEVSPHAYELGVALQSLAQAHPEDVAKISAMCVNTPGGITTMSNVWLDKMEEAKAIAETRGAANLLLRIDILRNKMKKAGKSLDEYDDVFSDMTKLDALCREYGVDQAKTVNA